MPKIIWFEGKEELDPFFVVADKITDATVLYEFKGVDSEEEGAEVSIGLDGIGSRWRAVQFSSHDAAEGALQSLVEIILYPIDGEYGISKSDGSWHVMGEE